MRIGNWGGGGSLKINAVCQWHNILAGFPRYVKGHLVDPHKEFKFDF